MSAPREEKADAGDSRKQGSSGRSGKTLKMITRNHLFESFGDSNFRLELYN